MTPVDPSSQTEKHPFCLNTQTKVLFRFLNHIITQFNTTNPPPSIPIEPLTDLEQLKNVPRLFQVLNLQAKFQDSPKFTSSTQTTQWINAKNAKILFKFFQNSGVNYDSLSCLPTDYLKSTKNLCSFIFITVCHYSFPISEDYSKVLLIWINERLDQLSMDSVESLLSLSGYQCVALLSTLCPAISLESRSKQSDIENYSFFLLASLRHLDIPSLLDAHDFIDPLVDYTSLVFYFSFFHVFHISRSLSVDLGHRFSHIPSFSRIEHLEWFINLKTNQDKLELELKEMKSVNEKYAARIAELESAIITSQKQISKLSSSGSNDSIPSKIYVEPPEEVSGWDNADSVIGFSFGHSPLSSRNASPSSNYVTLVNSDSDSSVSNISNEQKTTPELSLNSRPLLSSSKPSSLNRRSNIKQSFRSISTPISTPISTSISSSSTDLETISNPSNKSQESRISQFPHQKSPSIGSSNDDPKEEYLTGKAPVSTRRIPPISGFSWFDIPLAGASFLCPTGWVVRQKTRSKTKLEFSVFPLNTKKHAIITAFQGQILIRHHLKTKISSSDYVRSWYDFERIKISKSKNIQLISSAKKVLNNLYDFYTIVHFDRHRNHTRRIFRRMIVNKTTNTLYFLQFEIPEISYKRSAHLASSILSKFSLKAEL